jgi:flagellar protein FlaG
MKVMENGFSSVQGDALARSQPRPNEVLKALQEHSARVKEGIGVNLEQALEKLQRASRIYNTKLSFSVHKESNRIVVRIIDSDTNEVIRQIPPEEILHISDEIQKIIGSFVDNRR